MALTRAEGMKQALRQEQYVGRVSGAACHEWHQRLRDAPGLRRAQEHPANAWLWLLL